MILGNDVIKQLFKSERWKAFQDGHPIYIDRLNAGPHSIDVTLSNAWAWPQLAPGYHYLDPYEPESVVFEEFEENGLILPSQGFILGAVRERFVSTHPLQVEEEGELFHFHQIYDGRSTVGRLGVTSHCTAGYGDYGFERNFTLEIINHLPFPIMLHSGMRIGQISFGAVRFDSSYPTPYSGSYLDQGAKPKPPVLGKEHF